MKKFIVLSILLVLVLVSVSGVESEFSLPGNIEDYKVCKVVETDHFTVYMDMKKGLPSDFELEESEFIYVGTDFAYHTNFYIIDPNLDSSIDRKAYYLKDGVLKSYVFRAGTKTVFKQEPFSIDKVMDEDL